jgi:hypothetical protein
MEENNDMLLANVYFVARLELSHLCSQRRSSSGCDAVLGEYF